MTQKILDFDLEFNNSHIELEMDSPKDRYILPLELNHPSVKKVINIALELSKEHKLINTELLYNRAKKELKIPKVGLKTIIQMLLNKKVLVDGSRFIKMTVLKNKTRDTIYWLINTHIGAHFSFLKAKLSQIKKKEIGVGHLNWHLEKLIKFNLIRKVKVMNYTIFLPVMMSDEEGTLYFILRDKINKEIIEFLIENEPIFKSDLYKEYNAKRGKIYYRIKKLIEMKIISSFFNDEKYLSLNSEKKELILEVINKVSNYKKIENRNKLILMEI